MTINSLLRRRLNEHPAPWLNLKIILFCTG
jgi:hypothetical protein